MSDEKESKEEVERQAETMLQMDLVLGDEKVFIDYSEIRFNRTGERFIRDRPEQAKMAFTLIAAGFSNKAIGRKVHAEQRTIRELRYRCITEVEEQKTELRKIIFPGLMTILDKTVELAPNLNDAQKAAVAGGILFDKWQQLSGGVVSKVEVTGKIDIAAQVTHLLQQAEEKMKQAQATVITPELEQ